MAFHALQGYGVGAFSVGICYACGEQEQQEQE
jgi:hypothetical protein